MIKVIDKLVSRHCDADACSASIHEYYLSDDPLCVDVEELGWQHIDGRDLCPARAAAEKEGK